MKSSLTSSERRIKSALENLLKERRPQQDISRDPVQFVHRYQTPTDQELAGIVASCLAFGRVTAFLPKIKILLDIADSHGGPRAWIERFDHEKALEIEHISYRWNKAPDFALLCFTLQEALRHHETIGALFSSLWDPTEKTISPTLERFIDTMRSYSLSIAVKLDLQATGFADHPKGFRMFFCSPRDGSACKRWHLYLRWMIRQSAPDIGIWKISPSVLCIPLDTHIHSISEMLDISTGRAANHRAMMQITQFMQRLDPLDPIRFDFALAHLGISQDCKKRWIRDICRDCPLQSICSCTKPSGKEKTE